MYGGIAYEGWSSIRCDNFDFLSSHTKSHRSWHWWSCRIFAENIRAPWIYTFFCFSQSVFVFQQQRCVNSIFDTRFYTLSLSLLQIVGIASNYENRWSCFCDMVFFTFFLEFFYSNKKKINYFVILESPKRQALGVFVFELVNFHLTITIFRGTRTFHYFSS